MIGGSAYFTSRRSVGKKLAQELAGQRYYNTAVLALSPQSVLVAYEIAKQTYSPMALLMIKDVMLPDERTAFGVISDRGRFTNQMGMSKGQVEEFEMEYRNAIDHRKMKAMHDLNIIGDPSLIDPHFFRDKRVILVNDLTTTGTEFKAGEDFLHTVKTEKTILATAVAKREALWRMQEMADIICCVHSTDKDFPPEHYFEDNNIPSHDELVRMMHATLDQTGEATPTHGN